jgi:tetratricopeptide (TPR) repeat protein
MKSNMGISRFLVLLVLVPFIASAQFTRLMPVERYFLMDYEDAVNALDQAVTMNPQSSITLLRRAKFYRLVGQENMARNDVRLVERLNPYATDLYGFNGPYSILQVMAVRPEKYTVALSWDRRMSYYYEFLDQEYAKENFAETEVDRAEKVIEEIETESWREALAQLDTLLQFYPASAIAYDLKGVILTKQGKYEEATKAFEQAIQLEPSFAIAWYNFSRLEQEKGQLNKAEEYLNRSIQLQEDLTKAYFDRARVRKAQGDRKGALKDYNKVIDQKGETYLEAYLNRGLTRKMLGDYDGALEDINKVLSKDPENPTLYKSRADLYLLFGEQDLALQDYTLAIDLNDNYAEAYYNRGLALLLRFDRKAGCEDLTRAEQLGFETATEKKKYFCSKNIDLPLINY